MLQQQAAGNRMGPILPKETRAGDHRIDKTGIFGYGQPNSGAQFSTSSARGQTANLYGASSSDPAYLVSPNSRAEQESGMHFSSTNRNMQGYNMPSAWPGYSPGQGFKEEPRYPDRMMNSLPAGGFSDFRYPPMPPQNYDPYMDRNRAPMQINMGYNDFSEQLGGPEAYQVIPTIEEAKEMIRQALRLERRPGRKRPEGIIGEYFCDCGKDYMTYSGLSNHCKAKHGLIGRPRYRLLCNKVIESITRRPNISNESIEMLLRGRPPGFTPEMLIGLPEVIPHYQNQNSHTQRYSSEFRQHFVMPPPPAAPPQEQYSFGMNAYHFDKAFDQANFLGRRMMTLEGFPCRPNQLQAPPNLANQGPDTNSIESGMKEFMKCMDAWNTELSGSSKHSIGESGVISKNIGGLLASSFPTQTQTFRKEMREVELLFMIAADSQTQAQKVHSAITAGQERTIRALATFMVLAKEKISTAIFSELEILMIAFIFCLAQHGPEYFPAGDSCQSIPYIAEVFARDFFPSFILDSNRKDLQKSMKVLGICPKSHQRVFSTVRLITDMLQYLELSEYSLEWAQGTEPTEETTARTLSPKQLSN